MIFFYLKKMNSINLTLFLFLSFLHFTTPYMLGIDLGSEYFKICVIKPGKPFMMMENLLSQTKTEFGISLKDDEITYAHDALSKKAKSPSNAFNYLTEFLGKIKNSEKISEYLKDYFLAYELTSENETNIISFKLKFHQNGTELSVVELYAMLFDYMKFLAEKFTKIEMTDAFITIPSFFDYEQRQAIVDAVKVSHLNLAGLVSENLAAAVQFQLKRKFEKESFYIIYNMGSSFTQVSLISYKTLYDIKNNKTVDIGNEIKIYGESYNEKLGGKCFDKNLIELLMKKFDELPIRKNKNSVIGNKKIYEKMRSSAIKYKEVLSANKEAYITIINVENGDDLQTKITRKEFENINKNLISQVYEPIKKLLIENNLTIKNISQIELIGGSIRIPAVQEEIKKNLEENYDILGTHMNGDDSMAYGAAYMCANSSKNFLGSRKTYMNNGANEIFKLYVSNLENKNNTFKYCKENDINNLEINENCVRKINKEKEIFPLRYKYNSKRTITIDHDTNLLIKVTEEFPGKFKERDLKLFEITGVPEAITQMKNDNITKIPKITLKFIYSKGGQIELESLIKYKIPVYYNREFKYTKSYTEPLSKDQLEKIDSLLNYSVFISESEMKKLIKNTTNETEEHEEVTINEDENSTNSTNKTTTKKIKKEKPIPSNYTFNNTFYLLDNQKETLEKFKKIGHKKEKEISIYLTVKETHLLSPKPMNYTQIEKSRKKISNLLEIDKNRTKLIEKRNNLEVLIYKKKEWLESEHAKNYLKPTEIENSTIFINNKLMWYDDEGYAATYEILENEIKNITKYFKEYERRQHKHSNRTIAINKFLKELNQTQQRAIKTLTNKPWTKEYFNTTFMKEFNETLKWFNETLTKQENIPHWQPEILHPYMLTSKIDNLRKYLYEMTKMKNLTKEELENEKKTKKNKKKNKKNGDVDLDEILNRNNSDSLEDAVKKFSREQSENVIKNNTNSIGNNKYEEKGITGKGLIKKESDL